VKALRRARAWANVISLKQYHGRGRTRLAVRARVGSGVRSGTAANSTDSRRSNDGLSQRPRVSTRVGCNRLFNG